MGKNDRLIELLRSQIEFQKGYITRAMERKKLAVLDLADCNAAIDTANEQILKLQGEMSRWEREDRK